MARRRQGRIGTEAGEKRQARSIAAPGKASQREENERDDDLFPPEPEHRSGNAGRSGPFQRHRQPSMMKITTFNVSGGLPVAPGCRKRVRLFGNREGCYD